MTITDINETDINEIDRTRHNFHQGCLVDRIGANKETGQDKGRQPHQTPRILCIDDDPEISRALELWLQEYDVDVTVAFFGTQGFWETITNKPDLVLMDVLMPNGDGKFVLESIRNNKELETVPVVVLTGLRDTGLKNEMLALGADRFLKKPISFESLLCEMNRFINIRRSPEQ